MSGWMWMSCEGVGSIAVRVESFSSPLQGQITSVQTKTMLQHFPIKSTQQNVQFQLVTTGWPELKAIQDFVRGHQVKAMAGTSARPEIVLWYPERGIENWSGYIEKMPAGDRRFNVAPRVTLEFFLIDSLLSEKTWGSSLASAFSQLFGSDIGAGAQPGDEGFVPPAGFAGTKVSGSAPTKKYSGQATTKTGPGPSSPYSLGK